MKTQRRIWGISELSTLLCLISTAPYVIRSVIVHWYCGITGTRRSINKQEADGGAWEVCKLFLYLQTQECYVSGVQECLRRIVHGLIYCSVLDDVEPTEVKLMESLLMPNLTSECVFNQTFIYFMPFCSLRHSSGFLSVLHVTHIPLTCFLVAPQSSPSFIKLNIYISQFLYCP